METQACSPSLVASLCQALVRIPSVNPDDNPGTDKTGEAHCAQWIAQWLKTEFPGVQVETPEVLPGRPNVVARFPSNTSAFRAAYRHSLNSRDDD